MNILHGLTGSVAATLYPKINDNYNRLKRESNYNHIYVCTESSRKITDLSRANARFDEDEWALYKHIQQVLHIELVKWADVFIIAPCSANTLAKLANGICDNLLTCVARAWDFNKKIIIAPSMNTLMYTHPATKNHLDTLSKWGYIIVPPIEKKLYCGDVGIGAMAHIDDIIKII
jgi:phosphopantothenoylcysteine decarboxylase